MQFANCRLIGEHENGLCPRNHFYSIRPLNSGILLIGHGTRDPAGVREFLELAELVRQQAAPLPVAPCFLELAEPSIAAGVDSLVQQGVQRILVAPLLLFSAGHHQRDVPEAVIAALAAHPGISTAQLPAFNDHPRLLALSQQRLCEARIVSNVPVAEHPTGTQIAGCLGSNEVSPQWRNAGGSLALNPSHPTSSCNRLLLVVGRGSSDPAATGRLRDFAARRAGAAGVQIVLTCFVHGQRPTLAEGLALAAASSATTILVQPHLLFQGLVYQEIAAAVERAAAMSAKVWQLAAPLGPDIEIARAVLELAAPGLKL